MLQETDTHEYTIHPSVNIVSIYSQSECFNFSVESFFSIYRFLERFFAYTSFSSIVFITFGTKENVFFSFLLYLYSRLNRSCVRLVISERNYPLAHKISFLWKFLRRISYPLSNHLHVQSSFISHFYKKHLYKSCPPVSVILTRSVQLIHFKPFPHPFILLCSSHCINFPKRILFVADLACVVSPVKYSSITFHVYGSISSSNPSPPFTELSS